MKAWRRGLLACALVAGSFGPAPASEPMRHPAGCGAVAEPPWQALAPGVWVWVPTVPAEVSVANGGHVAPTTLVLGGSTALVIDPGPSHAHAWRVRESVRCRFRARVRWVVNTHAHAENVMGNSAFADEVALGAVEIMATAATREAMAQRCPACLASLRARVGEAAMAGTRIVLPGRTLVAGDELRVGQHVLKVLPVEQGHTEGDLLLWHAARRLLWAGGLVYEGRVPELAQGRLDDWLAALQRLQALLPAVVISTGVSRAGLSGEVPAALLATQTYLRDLRAGVLQAMDAGRQPQEPGVVVLPAHRSWVGYAERHDFNVQRAWRELEPVWMDQGPTPAPAAGSAQDIGR
jgi:glyoxylase-like metal-dependent hydrolase (beta-lactamase superfamily II)